MGGKVVPGRGRLRRVWVVARSAHRQPIIELVQRSSLGVVKTEQDMPSVPSISTGMYLFWTSNGPASPPVPRPAVLIQTFRIRGFVSSALPSTLKNQPHSTVFQLVMADGTPSARWVLWPAHQALVVRDAGEVELVPRPDGTLLLQGRCLQSQDQANKTQQPSLEHPNLGSHRKTWWQRWGLTVSKGSSRQGSRVHPP